VSIASTIARFRGYPAALAMRSANVFHAQSIVRNRVRALKQRLGLIDDFRSQRFVTLVPVLRPVAQSSLIVSSAIATPPAGFIFFSEDAHGVLVIDNGHTFVLVVVVILLLTALFVVSLTRGRYYSRAVLRIALPRVQSTILASHLIAPAFVLSFPVGDTVPVRLASAI
jgi:hypothetical protein